MRRQRVQEGLITVISAVEPMPRLVCPGQAKGKRLETQSSTGASASHLYFYYLHPQHWGFLHLRLQTLVSLPGAESAASTGGNGWLTRWTKRASSISRRDNCFEWIKRPGGGAAADGAAEPDPVATRFWSPLIPTVPSPLQGDLPPHWRIYYLDGLRKREYATDVMFKRQADLQAVYPAMRASLRSWKALAVSKCCVFSSGGTRGRSRRDPAAQRMYLTRGSGQALAQPQLHQAL